MCNSTSNFYLLKVHPPLQTHSYTRANGCAHTHPHTSFQEVFGHARDETKIKISFKQFQAHVSHFVMAEENSLTWQERAYLILSEPEYSLFGFYVSIFILFAILESTTTFVMGLRNTSR